MTFVVILFFDFAFDSVYLPDNQPAKYKLDIQQISTIRISGSWLFNFLKLALTSYLQRACSFQILGFAPGSWIQG